MGCVFAVSYTLCGLVWAHALGKTFPYRRSWYKL